jgi:uncharacterized tellurite resistance protein B-like protein
MSLLERLGLGSGKASARGTLAADIATRLRSLPPERAELVAAVAGLLARVAYADRQLSPAERAVLERLLGERTALTPAEATTAVEVVIRHETTLAGINYAALTRAFNAVATTAEKERFIDCLYAVASADRAISVAEDEAIRAVAHALLLSHGQFIAVRRRYKADLDVLKGLPPR